MAESPGKFAVHGILSPDSRACSVAFTVALVGVLSILWSSSSFAQTSDRRVWKDMSGKFSIEAELKSQDEKEVTLQKADGQQVTLPKGRLSKDDQEYLSACDVLKLINTQAAKIEPHLDKLITEPRSAIEALLAIQKAEPRDPCAMLWCGVALASEGGKPGMDKAERYLDDAILRLRQIHKHLPLAHPRTLTSALNNRAILALRDRKSNRATALFKEIATVEPSLPHFVSHNIQTLLDVTLENKLLELNATERRSLSELIVKGQGNPPLPLPRRFVYSTDFNGNQLPRASSSGSRLFALRENFIWPELTCFVCAGTSMVDCVKCVGGIATAYTQEQVGFNRTNQTPIMAGKAVRVPCEFCKGKSGFDCRNCQAGRVLLD